MEQSLQQAFSLNEMMVSIAPQLLVTIANSGRINTTITPKCDAVDGRKSTYLWPSRSNAQSHCPRRWFLGEVEARRVFRPQVEGVLFSPSSSEDLVHSEVGFALQLVTRASTDTRLATVRTSVLSGPPYHGSN